jgi:hypothetical protein
MKRLIRVRTRKRVMEALEFIITKVQRESKESTFKVQVPEGDIEVMHDCYREGVVLGRVTI